MLENRRSYQYRDDLSLYGKYLPKEMVPNKKFQKEIEKEVCFDTDPLSLALFYYFALNKRLVYDEVFEAFKQDLSIDIVKDIYNKDIHEVSSGNNRVICTTWTALFVYFLNKNGIEAVISGSGVHQYVIFKANGYLYRVDATTNLFDQENKTNMSDLTRVKLGLKPCGFQVIKKNEQSGISFQNIFDSDISLDNRIISSFRRNLYYQLEDVLENVSLQKLDIPTEFEEIQGKFSFIHTLLLQSGLDVIGGMTYLNSLIRVILSQEEQKRLSYDYLKEFDGKSIHYIQLINYSFEEKIHKFDYNFHFDTNGLNLVYRGGGLEVLSKRKARKLQEENDKIDIEGLEKMKFKRR